jgi:hypothetical protein
MKRTLLAVGIAVLISMMLIPVGDYRVRMWLPFFYDTAWLPWDTRRWDVLWTPFILQTVFGAVAAAMIVNLLPRRPRK